MRCTLEINFFNKLRDIREVEVCDSPSLSSILESGVVPSSGIDPVYHDMDNTDGILGRVRDGFEAVQLSRDIERLRSSRKPSESPVRPESPAPSAGSAE